MISPSGFFESSLCVLLAVAVNVDAGAVSVTVLMARTLTSHTQRARQPAGAEYLYQGCNLNVRRAAIVRVTTAPLVAVS